MACDANIFIFGTFNVCMACDANIFIFGTCNQRSVHQFKRIVDSYIQAVSVQNISHLRHITNKPYDRTTFNSLTLTCDSMSFFTPKARRNVANDFRIQLRYIIGLVKKTMSIECQRMWHQGGF